MIAISFVFFSHRVTDDSQCEKASPPGTSSVALDFCPIITNVSPKYTHIEDYEDLEVRTFKINF